MKKIVFLVSGNGGNLKFLYHVLEKGILEKVQLYCIADRQCGAAEFSRNSDINTVVISYKRTEPEVLQLLLGDINPDLIITNWNKIIDAKTVELYKGKMLNLHYSLLPAFGGLMGVEPINKAYEQGCKFVGATCHLVDENVDTGPILNQAVLPTTCHQTVMYERIFKAGCLILLNAIHIHLGGSEYKECFTTDLDYGNFEPRLKFDASLIDQTVWNEVAKK